MREKEVNGKDESRHFTLGTVQVVQLGRWWVVENMGEADLVKVRHAAPVRSLARTEPSL